MKKTFIFTACALFSICAAFSQDSTINCNNIGLTDSIYCKTYVKAPIEKFKTTFSLENYVVTFDKTYLKQLYHDVGDTTHVRIYFTSASATEVSLPGAVIVPFSKTNCQIDDSLHVITANYEKNPGYFGKLSAKTKNEIANWETLSRTSPLDTLGFVHGYNFSWNHILEACHHADYYGLAVAFGISNDDSDGSNKYAIHMYLTEAVENLDDRIFLDFSKPCPQLCGTTVGGGSGGQ